MDTPAPISLAAQAYEQDFHAWCVEQAARLRGRAQEGADNGLDYDNLAEEIEGLARSDRRAIKSHIRVLLTHLLKWRFQPEHRSNSWEGSINRARTEIADLLSDSPSLASYASDVIAKAYPSAARAAETETGLPRATFPSACPFSEADVLDVDFLPSD